MKPSCSRLLIALAAGTITGLVAWRASTARAQLPALGVAEGFEVSEYFQPENTQLKWRITGEKAEPKDRGRYVLTGLRIQTFQTNGQPSLLVEAAQCTYSPEGPTVESPGPLRFQSADGRLLVEGEGFQWRQKDQTLTISNRARTVLTGVIASTFKR